MQISMHNVETITANLVVFNGFNALTLTVTDAAGVVSEVKFFSDDLEKLTIINKAVRIAYDK